jgi:SpoVK/Ycf46/Vps4 family AAA+-type ATPase
MKKKNIINLIKYYSEGNDSGFRSEAYEIANDFSKSGDEEIASYIISLLSDANTFIPQMNNENLMFFKRVQPSVEGFFLPSSIEADLIGVANAIKGKRGVNKFLFEGAPGTGKTEAVRQLSRVLHRDLYAVAFDNIVDSKLGQTTKNIASLFQEIRDFPHPDHIMILFDELDAIALDRVDANDLREMGRATSAILREFDDLSKDVILFATTNLYKNLDKALVRRFDAVINFNRYTQKDLAGIAVQIFDKLSPFYRGIGKNERLFSKIIACMKPIPYPGDLENIIKTSIAFSDPSDPFDYLVRLFHAAAPSLQNESAEGLRKIGFTVREIALLTKSSKSTVAREVKKE